MPYDCSFTRSTNTILPLSKLAPNPSLPLIPPKTLQVLITSLLFLALLLPPGSSAGSQLLQLATGAPALLTSVRSVDEAVVIAAALSLCSSAFVLQLLSERGEAPTTFGSATLGILLLQDIAVVPFLVLLPLIESGGGMAAAAAGGATNLLQLLGPTALSSAAGLGVLLLGGRVVLRRVFEVRSEVHEGC